MILERAKALLVLVVGLQTQALFALPVQVVDPNDLQQDKYWWPSLVSTPLVSLLGDACYENLFEEFHFTDIPCLKLAISKALGLGIVVGGAIIKVPQIFTIVRHKSAKGLSFASFLLETSAYMIILMYNTRLHNPFSTFGEVLFMTIQNILISFLIVFYSTTTTSKSKVMAMLSMGFVIGFIFLKLIPSWLMSLLYAVQIPIGLASKIPQIKMNYLNRSTGQLSTFTVFSYFIGTTTRAFTTWTELDDPIMLGGNILASFLNSILVVQLIIYREDTKHSPILVSESTMSKAD
ncbi:uncharacterized protein B0P05DRAFT_546792 [Gilbertella persicaria]|uniref:uncharacterized protein n=1 Tax=Gilbertella persicaria TaxID=101096 RepID=UPI00221F859F|nr:uncharacterized protein B0P05DRAFT_546792 [Gilbertella persicaria]KAI8075886.1 hypothetical protein B0P05DRAFT_546792 [Gilbertella persicaria]